VRFEWEGEPSRAAHLGLLAQEVEGIIPEIVDVPDSADEHYGLSYIELVPVLIRAIQEQEARIETLETRVASLEEARQ